MRRARAAERSASERCKLVEVEVEAEGIEGENVVSDVAGIASPVTEVRGSADVMERRVHGREGRGLPATEIGATGGMAVVLSVLVGFVVEEGRLWSWYAL